MFMIFHSLLHVLLGQVIYSDNDELVSKESIVELDNRIKKKV